MDPNASGDPQATHSGPAADAGEVLYVFGPFCLDRVRRLLVREDQRVELTGRVFDTLLYLVEHRGRVIPKEELIAAVWRGAVVEERNLVQSISVLRKALGEGRKDHKYIVTATNRGYVFVAPVEEQVQAVEPAAAERAGEAARLSSRRSLLWAFGWLLVALMAAGVARWRSGAGDEEGPFRTLLVTSLSGREFLPALSPDGDRIAFVWDGDMRAASTRGGCIASRTMPP